MISANLLQREREREGQCASDAGDGHVHGALARAGTRQAGDVPRVDAVVLAAVGEGNDHGSTSSVEDHDR